MMRYAFAVGLLSISLVSTDSESIRPGLIYQLPDWSLSTSKRTSPRWADLPG
jgi:hypothetical protein